MLTESHWWKGRLSPYCHLVIKAAYRQSVLTAFSEVEESRPRIFLPSLAHTLPNRLN
jgi:hypothetical protein